MTVYFSIMVAPPSGAADAAFSVVVAVIHFAIAVIACLALRRLQRMYAIVAAMLRNEAAVAIRLLELHERDEPIGPPELMRLAEGLTKNLDLLRQDTKNPLGWPRWVRR